MEAQIEVMPPNQLRGRLILRGRLHHAYPVRTTFRLSSSLDRKAPSADSCSKGGSMRHSDITCISVRKLEVQWEKLYQVQVLLQPGTPVATAAANPRPPPGDQPGLRGRRGTLAGEPGPSRREADNFLFKPQDKAHPLTSRG